MEAMKSLVIFLIGEKMDRVDELYNQIKNDELKCTPDCPYQTRKECSYKQSCIYCKAIKMRLKEMLERKEDK